MDRDVLVPLLEPGGSRLKLNSARMKLVVVPVVFLDIVKVIPPDDGGPVHLQLGDHTGEDTATDGNLKQKEMRIEITSSRNHSQTSDGQDLSSEGALLVNVVSHASLSWGLEA